MNKTLLSIVLPLLLTAGMAPRAEAGPHYCNTRTYVSGHARCGCPVYSERYVAYRNHWGRPVYQTRMLPVRHRHGCRGAYNRSCRSHSYKSQSWHLPKPPHPPLTSRGHGSKGRHRGHGPLSFLFR